MRGGGGLSNKPCLLTFSLRPVLLEEAKGIHKGQIMHKIRLYDVSFVFCM